VCETDYCHHDLSGIMKKSARDVIIDIGWFIREKGLEHSEQIRERRGPGPDIRADDKKKISGGNLNKQ
jgi:hypothetical protein